MTAETVTTDDGYKYDRNRFAKVEHHRAKYVCLVDGCDKYFITRDAEDRDNFPLCPEHNKRMEKFELSNTTVV